jgi:hydroxyethylthiazole kinase-like uncharacterized protein yjeF
LLLIDRADILTPVLDAAAMRAADAFTIHDLGMPGKTLMEMAGRDAARLAAHLLADKPSRVLICAGKGNNGGDGLVAARWLLEMGYPVRILLTAAPSEMSADCAANLAVLTRMDDAGLTTDLTITHAQDWAAEDLPGMRADLIIDALFGTGLESALRAPFDALVRAMNRHEAPILALDLPSGLSASTGHAFDPCVSAAATLTMGALKSGLLLEDGPDVCGAVEVADIGIPASVLIREASSPGSGFLSTNEWVSSHLRPRTRHDHKYSTGPTLVAGGSMAFPGAPMLAARAAARAGSGYVVVMGPETMPSSLQELGETIPVGVWTSDADAESSIAELIGALDTRWTKARALLVGPGMGRASDTQARIWALLDRFSGPVVLDADALFAIKDERERVADASNENWILTPHDGELSRLEAAPKQRQSRIERVCEVARMWNCVVLAKGQPSITAAPDGRVIINGSGHPAAATAGSGDVLAGVTAGLLAQGLEPFAAAAAGIHIGGTAVGQFVQRGAAQSLVATDILDSLPNVLRQLS